jgi:F-type H+-transporting ATPase subunit a
MIFSPLEQFSIFQKLAFIIQMKLLGISLYFDISVTIFLIENFNNFLVFFFLLAIYVTFLETIILKANSLFSYIYSFLFSIMQQQVKENFFLNKYFILICTIFLFILVNNLFGMIPYSFVSTAQLGQNFFLSSSLILFFTILGFFYLEEIFLHLFIPSAPKLMVPFLVLIEVISYIAWAFSLAIRLFANLMSGHTLLFILCSFNSIILTSNFFAFIIASLIILLIFGLELVIAFMQAYVFTVLVSVYLKDSTSETHH